MVFTEFFQNPLARLVPPGGPRLKERFLAWWEGYYLPTGRRGSRADKAGDAIGAADRNLSRNGKPIWTASRIEVAEKLWGTGFTGPGGEDLVPDLIHSLALTPAKSVLDLSAGLGGACRMMAEKQGAWADGLEANPVLAAAGMERVTKAGLAKKAPIRHYDPEAFRWPKRVDVVFAREAFFTVANKPGVASAVSSILKPGGQFLFTDYTLEEGATAGPWTDAEPLQPHLCTAWEWIQRLREVKLDVRIVQDISDQHRASITAALKQFSAHLRAHELDHDTMLAVQDEISLWGARIAALGAGMRQYRFHAIRFA